jgi:hypothetical protein
MALKSSLVDHFLTTQLLTLGSFPYFCIAFYKLHLSNKNHATQHISPFTTYTGKLANLLM